MKLSVLLAKLKLELKKTKNHRIISMNQYNQMNEFVYSYHDAI